MRRGLIASLLILSVVGASGCGDSNERGGSGVRGFSERDRKAARQFSQIQAQSPSLDSLANAVNSEDPDRMKTALRKLRTSAKRFQGVEFDDPRARRAMRAFTNASSRVVSAYSEAVDYRAGGHPSASRGYVLIRELQAAVDERNEADRRL